MRQSAGFTKSLPHRAQSLMRGLRVAPPRRILPRKCARYFGASGPSTGTPVCRQRFLPYEDEDEFHQQASVHGLTRQPIEHNQEEVMQHGEVTGDAFLPETLRAAYGSIRRSFENANRQPSKNVSFLEKGERAMKKDLSNSRAAMAPAAPEDTASTK